MKMTTEGQRKTEIPNSWWLRDHLIVLRYDSEYWLSSEDDEEMRKVYSMDIAYSSEVLAIIKKATDKMLESILLDDTQLRWLGMTFDRDKNVNQECWSPNSDGKEEEEWLEKDSKLIEKYLNIIKAAHVPPSPSTPKLSRKDKQELK